MLDPKADLDPRGEDGDVALLESIRNDEPGAFDSFVARFGDRIFGFGMRMCGEREDARDVVQETLLQAFRGVREVREPRALRSWLYRVATNACLMKRRRGKFDPKDEISLEDLMPRDLDGATLELPDGASLPDEELQRAQLQATIREAVNALPEHYRIVLVMRDMEQLSTAETVAALGLSESTVKMRLHRARLMVRERLGAAIGRGATATGE